jgi:hypothetical protein
MVKRAMHKLTSTIIGLIGALALLTAGATAQTPALSLTGGSAAPGNDVTVGVNLTPGSIPAASLQWDISYSSSVLSLVSAPYDAIGTAGSAAGKSAACNAISAGDVRCIISGINTNGIGTGAVATLTFKIAAGTTDTSTPVSLASTDASDANGNSLGISGTGATVTIDQPAPVTVAAVSASPSSGSGASQNFALEYSDSAGAASLQWVWVWFNATMAGSASNSCMLYYEHSTNQVNLLNNAGTAWTAATPGGAGALQNSQCSVNMAATSVTLNGNTLTLNLAMTFDPGFNGAKNVYLYGGDLTGSNSGWQQRGTWTASSVLGTTTAVSVTPNSGSGAIQTFALVFSDTAGAASLQSAWVWFNATFAGTAASSCMLYYQPSTNQVSLLNDAGTAWMSATPGAAATTLQNSQCSLNAAATSVMMNGDTLTLNLAMTFQAAFGGAKNAYTYGADVSGTNSGWQQLGTWTVPATGTPTAVSVTPSSGSGLTQTFALMYSDTAEASSLEWVWVWFNATFADSAENSCMLYYQSSTNQVNLLNDAGTVWMAATPGTVASLANSQCSVNMKTSSVVLSGDNLILNLAMTFQSGFSGAKNTYMYAGDVSGSSSGWPQEGAWTVP